MVYQEVHVVNGGNAQFYQKELREFFQVRHDIYVDEKGWRDPASDGFEFDQYDNDAATYLIGLDENGRVITGSRFVPTDLPHLLIDVFPHACREFVRRRNVAEWTRGFIIPGLREAGGVKIKSAFCAAVQEWCLSEGITEVGGIQEIYWLPLWKRLGWSVRQIGDPLVIDEEMCVAAYFEVSEAALSKTERRAGLGGSILKSRGTPTSFLSIQADSERGAIDTMIRT
jgi:acyl-homoserine lactone synthase